MFSPAALAAAIALCGGHARVARKVIGEEAMVIKPVGYPHGLIAVGRGIFQNGFPGYLLKSGLVRISRYFSMSFGLSVSTCAAK